MTNIKARGFENAEQICENLAELDDEGSVYKPAVEGKGVDLHEHINALRRHVAELHQRLSLSRDYTDGVSMPTEINSPWRRVAVTVAATFVLGRVVQKLRVGTAGAAAVPLIAAQVGRRF